MISDIKRSVAATYQLKIEAPQQPYHKITVPNE